MMRAIYKYAYGTSVKATIEMPVDATIIRVAYQKSAYGDGLMIWAEVFTDEPMEKVNFKLFATGEKIRPTSMEYVASIENPQGMIIHLYKDLSIFS